MEHDDDGSTKTEMLQCVKRGVRSRGQWWHGKYNNNNNNIIEEVLGERWRWLRLIRIRTALLFYTWDTNVRPVVLPTRDEPICRDNGAPTVRSISSPDPLCHGPGNGTPTTDASLACHNARKRVHLCTGNIKKKKKTNIIMD